MDKQNSKASNILPLEVIEKKSKTPKKINPNSFENSQLNLFQDFLANKPEEKDKLSNAIELWDSTPKYPITLQAQNKLRNKSGGLPLLKLEFKFGDTNYKVEITPAKIEVPNKDTGAIELLEFYPSANEELVEEALRKLAAEQFRGYFDKSGSRSGVVFTLYQLEAELKKRKHARSLTEIQRSLTILNKSSIEIQTVDKNGDTAFGRSNYLPVLGGVTRQQYQTNPNSKWLAQFHPLVTESIENLTYRQYNYEKLMNHSTQLARYVHKLLIIKYTFASHAQPFKMQFSTVERDSALLNQYSLKRQAVAALDSALKELVKNKVLMSWSKSVVRGEKNKIVDVVYLLVASVELIQEVKASNLRLKNAKQVIVY
jgi:hypothetical protein